MISDTYDQALSEDNNSIFVRQGPQSTLCQKKRCLQELPLTGILLFTKVFFLMNGRYWDSVTPTLSIRSDTNELLDVCISRDSNVAQVH